MNTTTTTTSLLEMLRCMQSGNSTASAEMTVLERQQARQKWQHHHPQQQQQNQHQHQTQPPPPQQSSSTSNYFSTDTQFNIPLLPPTNLQDFHSLMLNNDSVIRDFVNRSMKLDPGVVVDNGWPDFGKYPLPLPLPQTQTQTLFGGETTMFVPPPNTEFPIMMDYSLSRTASCPPTMPEPVSMNGKENTLKKRKTQNSKVAAEEVRNKRIKADSEEESKITEQNNSNSSNSNNNKNNSNKEASKNSEAKQDYIHVRARRGQATDSHSLAERVRREKISERMKYLQDLVPGCNKITGKAGMLDEIINYVQSLQRQVEFLSMKLAAVNPRLDINIENLFTKEMFSPSSAGFPSVGTSSEMPNCPPYLPFNSLQQLVSTCGLDMVMNSSEGALQRTRSAPVSDGFLETSCFNQAQPSSSTWETDMQNLYNNVEFNQGRPTTSFPPQSFTGILEANNLKMEM